MIAELNDTEVGRQGGKGIVGDLGARRREHREQCGLPRVRLTDQTDIGNELEHQLEGAMLALLPRLPFAWRLMRGRHERRIPAAPSPSAGDEQLVAIFEN